MRIARSNEAERIERLVLELRDAKKRKAEAEAEEKLIAKSLIELLAKVQEKSGVAKDGGKAYKATVVRQERVNIDEPGLIKALTDEETEQVTDRKVNRTKLDAAMEDDTFFRKAEPYLTMAPTNPFIRFTEGANDDFDEDTE